MSKTEWNYSGDVNLEYGGMFWKWDGGPDYVLAVEIVPYSDMGGPNNVFIVENGSIYLPLDVDARNDALDTIGYSARPAPLWALVDAFRAYHGIDRDAWRGGETVQIGKTDPFWDKRGPEPEPDKILRSNASLAKYVARKYLA